MTPAQIAADVARGIEIRNQITLLEAELDAIETRLEQAALKGEHVPLQDADREGKQFLARGDNRIVPVRFESDLIAGSFQPDSVMHNALIDALGDNHFTKLPKLFKDTRTFARVPKDGQAFRKVARELLPPDIFANVIRAVTQRDKAGIAKSKTVIAWEDSRPITAAV